MHASIFSGLSNFSFINVSRLAVGMAAGGGEAAPIICRAVVSKAKGGCFIAFVCVQAQKICRRICRRLRGRCRAIRRASCVQKTVHASIRPLVEAVSPDSRSVFGEEIEDWRRVALTAFSFISMAAISAPTSINVSCIIRNATATAHFFSIIGIFSATLISNFPTIRLWRQEGVVNAREQPTVHGLSAPI